MKIEPKAYISLVLKSTKQPFVKEYKFLPNRRFRFDFAITDPNVKVAIEYEGIMSKKARHTSITGYTRDTEKYNLAVLDGWRVLRYTVLNYQNITNDLKAILEVK